MTMTSNVDPASSRSPGPASELAKGRITEFRGAEKRYRCDAQSRPIPLRPVTSTTDVCFIERTIDVAHEDVYVKPDVVVIPGSDVDGADEFSASLVRPHSDAPFDDGAQVLQFTPRGPALPIQSNAEMTSVSRDARSVGLDHSAAIELMTDATMRLARRNEALEDFAALVAHELKSPLEAALLADDPRRWIVSALDLAESLLQTATESPDGAWASVPDCLPEEACCEHPIQLTVASDQGTRFPLAPGSLSVILRNLLANAASAKARRVDVFTGHRCGQWWLVVDDDGVGLGAPDEEYSHGSGIGLELCRRIAARNGGRLELLPRQAGGTRAVLTMERAA